MVLLSLGSWPETGTRPWGSCEVLQKQKASAEPADRIEREKEQTTWKARCHTLMTSSWLGSVSDL